MERWLIFALAAAIFWGANAVLVKIIISPDYFGLEASRANLFVALGIILTMVIYDRAHPIAFSGGKLPAYALAVGVGVMWALGNIFAFESIRAGGQMSQVVPIYNTNTLIAVVLVMLILKEMPTLTDRIRILIGASLITAGAILVSWRGK